jgi:5-methyltetrahydrofolate--homocysteine methyltransferase
MSDLAAVFDAVLNGDDVAASTATRAALDSGVSASEILGDACIPAMDEIGRLYEVGERYVPELLIAARAMQRALQILEPLLAGDSRETAGKVVIGTVAGDLHDIGKNLVAMMLNGAGFDVIDLGTDVTPSDFVTSVQQHAPDMVALSALLTSTMASISATIDALSEAGLRENVKVIIGGAPVTQGYAENVAADGYAPDAASGARMAKDMLARSSVTPGPSTTAPAERGGQA